MTRVLKGMLALVALLALWIGAPVVLVRVGRLDFSGVLNPLSPDDGTLLISLVTLVGWLCWALATLESLTDLVAGLSRGRWRWRPAVGAWIRPLTSVLVAAVLAMTLAKADGGSPPVGTTVAASSGAQSAAKPDPDEAQPGTEKSPLTTAVHVVQPGEDLWAVAASVLGDGSKWRVLADLNPGLGDAILTPGMELVVPTSPPAQEDAAAEVGTGDRYVTVAAGDSLWSLAGQWLGDPHRWPEIMRANQHLIGDPDEIEIGWVLRIPPLVAEVTTTPPTTLRTLADERPGRTAATDAADDPERPGVDTRASAPDAAPTPTEENPTDAPVATSDPLHTDDPVRLVAGGITAALAAGIGVGLANRRRHQLAGRAPGLRVAHPGATSTRFATALGRLAARAEPLSPSPTSVLVGEDEDGRSVLVDLGAHQVTAVVAEPSTAVDLMGGMATSLMCADWSSEVLVTVVSEPLAWAVAFDHPGLEVSGNPEQALARWSETAAQRHARATDDDDSPSEVYLFCEELPPAGLRRLVAARHPKMHAVVAQATARAGETITVTERSGTISSTGQRFVPQLLDEPARRALVELHDATTAADTPAPWWYHPPEGVDPPTPLISRDRPTLPPAAPLPDDEGVTVHQTPKLLLLGPIQLVGAQGPQPARASKQLIEYCAWILENPGRRSTQMSTELMVAESTRRSNMSRLRRWLGASADGEAFLPEAYTGRITLHPEVSSDWEALQLKLAGGVNRAPSQVLVDALTMVRGAPLADAAPGQWHWAEEMRSDMISTIRDMAVVLGHRALQVGDLDTARWAAHRALQAAPEDELLMGIKIRCEHLSGNRPEVERMVLQVTRQARLVGSDLHEETVALLQEVMEGRPRSQRA
ncbi:LysM peptidoglycan-binding domain-containing protein [Aestuariimicrobium sp. Y1814]|uniref:LysM peptidoglycan-binding domain-containing protein n=1 Tax=Aestuariimicrobium sp. Y1814 TaxID=3418742 RepID=UPI003DA71F2E